MKVRTKYILLTVVVAVVVAIDLLTKHFLGDISYTEIIPNLIHFETNNGNDGAAWGIFSGKKGLLIAIGIIGLIIFKNSKSSFLLNLMVSCLIILFYLVMFICSSKFNCSFLRLEAHNNI